MPPYKEEEEDVLLQEVARFDRLVKKRSGFNECDVVIYGKGDILSPLCRVPEGIKFEIDSKIYEFDTAEHIHLFICYGCKSNIDKWTRGGGVMGSFMEAFGDDKMEKKYGDTIGIIPQLLIQSHRAQLRSAHGIQITSVPQIDESKVDHYDHWRSILHAKFASSPTAMKALMDTGDKYIIDKDSSCKIVYPENANHHKKKNGGSSSGNRQDGAIIDKAFKNKFGKYLMAIRSEITLMNMKSDA